MTESNSAGELAGLVRALSEQALIVWDGRTFKTDREVELFAAGRAAAVGWLRSKLLSDLALRSSGAAPRPETISAEGWTWMNGGAAPSAGGEALHHLGMLLMSLDMADAAPGDENAADVLEDVRRQASAWFGSRPSGSQPSEREALLEAALEDAMAWSAVAHSTLSAQKAMTPVRTALHDRARAAFGVLQEALHPAPTEAAHAPGTGDCGCGRGGDWGHETGCPEAEATHAPG